MNQKIDNRYTILRVLGTGLSGEVLAVEDENGKSALKLLKRVQLNVSAEEALSGFKSEFAILKELGHPGIGRILDFGYERTRQKYYFTTELIEGRDLFAATEGRSFDEIEDLAVQILRALNYLHSRGIYHFDLKPQNVLTAEKDGKLIAKIIDFGLAGFSSPRKKVGTPAYMAPEVILGGNLDNRTDLYSFGVMLYKVLTRVNPFASKNLQETLARQKSLVPEPPSRVNTAVPKFWDNILPRLLEKNPADRYTDAAGVIRDIAFISGHHYDIETQESRLSYLPEKGTLIAREEALKIFEETFSKIFEAGDDLANRLLVIAGGRGTGKTRLLSEFKYLAQLRNVPVYSWAARKQTELIAPYCLQVDDALVTAEEINAFVQQSSGQPVLVIWATETLSLGLTHASVIESRAFSMDDLKAYLATVTGQKNPPPALVQEIFNRTAGNPLFVSELLRTMLENNLLLDASGRWASTTFEDIGINFEAIRVPATLAEMLVRKYEARPPAEREILNWMAVFNRPVSAEELTTLCSEPPQTSLLSLTHDGLIERINREQHYYFSNWLMRDAIYERLEDAPTRHDRAADFLKKDENKIAESLFHEGHGTKADSAVAALQQLGEIRLASEQKAQALEFFEMALARAQKERLPHSLIRTLEKKIADAAVVNRDYKKALTHYQQLIGKAESRHEEAALLHEKLGDLHVRLDAFDQARPHFEKALDLIRQNGGDPVREMVIENHLANGLLRTGAIDDAIAHFAKTAEAWDAFTPAQRSEVTNNNLASAYMIKGDHDRALRRISHDLAFFAGIKNSLEVARLYWLKGEVFLKRFLNASEAEKKNLKPQVLAAFTEGLHLFREAKAKDMLLRCYNGIGSIHFYSEDYDQAREHYERALALARQLGDVGVAVALSMNIANIHRVRGHYREAYPYYIYAINAALGITARNAHHWSYLFQCYVEMGETLAALGDIPRAEESLNNAEEILKNQPHLAPYEYGLWLNRAKIYRSLGHDALLQQALRKTESLATEGFAREEFLKLKNEIDAARSEKSPTAPTISKPKPMNEPKPLTANDLETILQINKFINSEHNPELLMKIVLNYALELSGAESGLILLLNDKDELEVKSSVNTTVDEETARYSTSIAKKALEMGEVIVSADAITDARFDSSESVVLGELKSILCLPLKSRNHLIGVLYLDNRFQTNTFANVNLKILFAYGDQVSIALENARLIEELKTAQKKLEEKLEKTTGQLNEAREMLKSEVSAYISRYSYDHIISRSKPMREVFRVLDKVTETNLTIYLHGASGTGKELIARAIHYNNPQRAEKRFVAINCGAIPANLIESELFGYKAGAFTGANKDKKGLFEEAHGGTLFLDEIAELELNLQVKLLRVLQEGEITPVGGTKSAKVDVRIVCASHKLLEDQVKKNLFREDLFYRLCQMKVSLPSLKERPEDIPLLVEHFIEKFRKENRITTTLGVAPVLMRALVGYAWPGNVRELENTVHVACALRSGDLLDLSSLPPNHAIATHAGNAGEPAVEAGPQIPIDTHNTYDPRKTWENYETLIIAKSLEFNGFRKNDASTMLGISPSTIYKKIRDHGMEDRANPLYHDGFVYEAGHTLKDYIPKIFKAALDYHGGHPYAAIRQLHVSQGYFYKILKIINEKSMSMKNVTSPPASPGDSR